MVEHEKDRLLQSERSEIHARGKGILTKEQLFTKFEARSARKAKKTTRRPDRGLATRSTLRAESNLGAFHVRIRFRLKWERQLRRSNSETFASRAFNISRVRLERFAESADYGRMASLRVLQSMSLDSHRLDLDQRSEIRIRRQRNPIRTILLAGEAATALDRLFAGLRGSRRGSGRSRSNSGSWSGRQRVMSPCLHWPPSCR